MINNNLHLKKLAKIQVKIQRINEYVNDIKYVIYF